VSRTKCRHRRVYRRITQAQSIVGSASAWLPMGCAQTFVMMLSHNQNQGAHDALAQPFPTACGPPRSLPVVPSLANEGTTERPRGDSGGAAALSAAMGQVVGGGFA